jgi:hypothetical protein
MESGCKKGNGCFLIGDHLSIHPDIITLHTPSC